METVPLTIAVTAAQVPVFTVWLLIAPKQAVLPGYWLPGSVVLILSIAANLLLIRALSVAPLSLTIPYLSLTPVLTSVVAALVLGEWPTRLQWMGIGAVVAGAALLSFAGLRRSASSLERARAARGRWMMITVASLWAVTGPMDKLALRHASVSVHALVQTGGIATVLAAFMALKGQLGQFKPFVRAPGLALATILFASVGIGMQFTAIQLTLVSVVETVKRAVGMLSALLSGQLLFKEPLTAAKVGSALLMGVGVALVLV